MAVSEEEQLAAMLAEMGLDSIEAIDEVPISNPIAETPVNKSKALENGAMNGPEETVGKNANSLEQVEELPFSEVQESPQQSAPGSDESRLQFLSRPVLNKELSTSSLIHLMGLPTSVQVNVLDTKLDLLTTKLSTIQSKLDRIQSQLDMLSMNSPIERIEFQMTEVRSIMKKFFPLAFQDSAVGSTSLDKSKLNKPQVLSNKIKNSPAKEETKIVTDVSENVSKDESEEALSDEDYQVMEAMKLRQKNTLDR